MLKKSLMNYGGRQSNLPEVSHNTSFLLQITSIIQVSQAVEKYLTIQGHFLLVNNF